MAGTVMRLAIGALKSITPLRAPSLALQVAPKLAPGWVVDGLVSTMTLLTGAESKLNRRRSESSITSCALKGYWLETTSAKAVRTRGRDLVSGSGKSIFMG